MFLNHNFFIVKKIIMKIIVKNILPVGLVADAVTNYFCCIADNDKGIGIDPRNQPLQG